MDASSKEQKFLSNLLMLKIDSENPKEIFCDEMRLKFSFSL